MISIVVPVYNVEKYISKCITSILNQTYKDYELILVDDGSTDGSGQICDEYLHLPNVTVIHKQNGGISSARNAGIDVAKGEYISIIDPDDWVDFRMLETMATNIDDNDVIICNASIAMSNRNGIFEYSDKIVSCTVQEICSQDEILRVLVSKTATVWNKVWKRELFFHSRFNENIFYGEDSLFWAEVAPFIKSIKMIPDKLYYYYVNRPGNIVSSGKNKNIESFLQSGERIYDICSSRGIAEVGMIRISIILDESLNKIANNFSTISEYRELINRMTNLARYSSRNDFFDFLKSTRVNLKRKVSYTVKRVFGVKVFLLARIMMRKLIKKRG